MTGRTGLLGGGIFDGRLVGAMLTEIDGVGRATFENREPPEVQRPFEQEDPAGHLEQALPI